MEMTPNVCVNQFKHCISFFSAYKKMISPMLTKMESVTYIVSPCMFAVSRAKQGYLIDGKIP